MELRIGKYAKERQQRHPRDAYMACIVKLVVQPGARSKVLGERLIVRVDKEIGVD